MALLGWWTTLARSFTKLKVENNHISINIRGFNTALQLQKTSRTLMWTGVFPFVVEANDRGAKITEGANSFRQRLTSFSTKVPFSPSLSPTAVSGFFFLSSCVNVAPQECLGWILSKSTSQEDFKMSFFHSVSCWLLSSLLFIKVSFGGKKKLGCRSALLVFNKSLFGLSASSVTLPWNILC